MANLPENPNWEPGIRQLELTDPVQGGPDGVDNIAPKQLANRTAWLKQEVELRAPLASPALTGNPTAPTQAPGDNSTRLATTAFVAAAALGLLDGALLRAGGEREIEPISIIGNALSLLLRHSDNSTTARGAAEFRRGDGTGKYADLVSLGDGANGLAEMQLRMLNAAGAVQKSFRFLEDGTLRLGADPANALDAATKGYADGEGDLSTGNGHWRFPGGLMVQSMISNAAITGEQEVLINFPTTFPNNCYGVIALPRIDAAQTNQNTWFQFREASTSQATLYHQAAPSSPSFTSQGYRAFAWGR